MRVLLLLLLAASAASAARVRVPAGAWLAHAAAPHGWVEEAGRPAGGTVRLLLALRQRAEDLEELERLAWEAADPDSAQHGRARTAAEVRSLVRPARGASRAVGAWLAAEPGARVLADLGDALDVECTAAAAERLFAVRLGGLRHVESGARATGALRGEATVPAEVAPHLELVEGLVGPPPPPLPRRGPAARAAGHPAAPAVLPQTVWRQYRVPESARAASPNRTAGVVNLFAENFSPRHLAQYWSAAGLPGAPPEVEVRGPNNASAPRGEADLDAQVVAGVGVGGRPWFFKFPQPAWMYGLGARLAAEPRVPLAVSVSYGFSELYQCRGLVGTECRQMRLDSAAYVRRANAEYQKVALRGVTLAASSGDSGAPGRADPYCLNVNQTLAPSFPASSPYVLAVGGTMLGTGAPRMPAGAAGTPPVCSYVPLGCAAGGGGGVEVAPTLALANYTSGGGFSYLHGRPAFQAAAVARYLGGATPFPPAFNRTGRATPDLAALSFPWFTVGAAPVATRGTSVSAPLVAALVAMLGEAAGRPLGLAAPLLYEMAARAPATFTDVTEGANRCTEWTCRGCAGYLAAPGWDAVTGLGTPAVDRMLEYVAARW